MRKFKMFNIYLLASLFGLCLGLNLAIGAMDFPGLEDLSLEDLSDEEKLFIAETPKAPPLENMMEQLNALETNPVALLRITAPEKEEYLNMIAMVQAMKGDSALYTSLEAKLKSLRPMQSSAPISPPPAATQEKIDPEVAQIMLLSLQDNPVTISDPTTPLKELNNYLAMINATPSPSDYSVLKGLIEEEIATRAAQEAPQAAEEKSAEERAKEEGIRNILLFLSQVPGFQKIMTLKLYPPDQKKNMIEYIWQEGLASDPQFAHTYQLLTFDQTLQLHNLQQAMKNNLEVFSNDAQFVPLPVPGNPDFGYYLVNMNKIKVGGRPMIKRQRGLDCGFHAAFNGLELYRFAQGRIDKKKLEELLPNFNVDVLKSCPADSYISSEALDTILKNHGLTEQDYSIIESIEQYNVSMDIVEKLALALFDPAITNYSHVIIINSLSRDHWTVAVVNKTNSQIRVYIADSLAGTKEAEHIEKIMKVVAQVNVNAKEFETLMQINRTLSSIADIKNALEKSQEQKRQSTIINLLSMLPALYTANASSATYFLENFLKPILEYVNDELKPYQPDIASSMLGFLPIYEQKEQYDITKKMLEQLQSIVKTTELPTIPPVQFDQTYNTLLDKYGLITLLELHRIRNSLNEQLENATAQNIDSLLNAIAEIRIDLDNKNAYKGLYEAIGAKAQSQ